MSSTPPSLPGAPKTAPEDLRFTLADPQKDCSLRLQYAGEIIMVETGEHTSRGMAGGRLDTTTPGKESARAGLYLIIADMTV